MAETSKILLSRREAAGALNVSIDTLANLISAGELKPVYIGKSVLVPREEITALIARGGRGKTQSAS